MGFTIKGNKKYIAKIYDPNLAIALIEDALTRELALYKLLPKLGFSLLETTYLKDFYTKGIVLQKLSVGQDIRLDERGNVMGQEFKVFNDIYRKAYNLFELHNQDLIKWALDNELMIIGQRDEIPDAPLISVGIDFKNDNFKCTSEGKCELFDW